jgi:hypothetical protein
MAGWVLRWLSAVRTRLDQRLDLLLEFIVLRHQIAVLQRTGTRRPCFRPSERLFRVFLSRRRANWQRGLIIVQLATVLRWCRRSFWAIWVSGSCGRWRGGRPRISGEVRALIVRMSRENFLWGAPRIHGELLKRGFVVSQATVSRYMPRRGYPPTQRWRTFLRNQAFAIGAISFGEAGRLPDVVRGRIMRVVRSATKVRDRIPCELIKPSSTLHPLWPYRSSNRADRRVAQRRCVPGSSAVHTSKRRPLDLPSRQLSPYRSRASPGRKLPGIRELHTIIRYRAQSQADHNSFTAIALCVCHEQSETRPKFAPKGKESLLLPGAPAAIRLSRTRL